MAMMMMMTINSCRYSKYFTLSRTLRDAASPSYRSVSILTDCLDGPHLKTLPFDYYDYYYHYYNIESVISAAPFP